MMTQVSGLRSGSKLQRLALTSSRRPTYNIPHMGEITWDNLIRSRSKAILPLNKRYTSPIMVVRVIAADVRTTFFNFKTNDHTIK